MNLSVSTHWPPKMPGHLAGQPTNFRVGILNSLLSNYPIAKQVIESSPKVFRFKPHTIREDKNNRWKPGMRIHFFEWTGKAYRSKQFKFAPLTECVSVQAIEIVWHDTEGNRYVNPAIYVDDVWMVGKDLETLAHNDGFDTVCDFYAWFNQDFYGRIIHWTDLKY